MFMLAAAWTLQVGGHVRVDIFYADASPRTKALVDLLGSLLLLLPFVAVILWFALPYVARSWALLERSRETSGLPFVYLLKTLIPLFAVLIGAAGHLAGDPRRARARCTRPSRPATTARLMPLAETLAVLMVVAVCVALLAGYPVALTLGGVSLAFAVIGAPHGRDEFQRCSARCRSACSA